MKKFAPLIAATAMLAAAIDAVSTQTPRFGFRVLGNSTNRRRLVAAGAALAQPPEGATVIGQRAEEGMSTRVSYADLNLASLPGEQTLNRRVGRAAFW